MQKSNNSVQLIFGLGKTGLSCAEFLNQQAIPFRAMDSRDVAPHCVEIKAMEYCETVLMTDPNEQLTKAEKLLCGIKQIIVSPGVAKVGSFFELVKRLKINIIGDIELFAQQVKAPVIAITGSNGKSTVTELTGELLKAAGKKVLVGGNIGIPVLDLLKQQSPDFYVLELSSFQLETTNSLKPIAATVLNLSDDHLDRYDSFKHYCDTKMSVLKQAEKVVVSTDEFSIADDEILSSVEPENLLSFSLELSPQLIKSSEVINYCLQQQKDNSIWIANSERALINKDDLKIAGLHNTSNAMAALALCEAAGVNASPAVISALAAWPGLEHRCQYVAEINGIHCYNDSKATNVGSTVAALQGLAESISGKFVLIAGGDGKGADFIPLKALFKRYVSALIVMGKDAERLLTEAGTGIRSVIVDDMKQAVKAAFEYANPGDAILLSPACSSLDMYPRFEKRGELFCHEVEALK